MQCNAAEHNSKSSRLETILSRNGRIILIPTFEYAGRYLSGPPVIFLIFGSILNEFFKPGRWSLFAFWDVSFRMVSINRSGVVYISSSQKTGRSSFTAVIVMLFFITDLAGWERGPVVFPLCYHIQRVYSPARGPVIDWTGRCPEPGRGSHSVNPWPSPGKYTSESLSAATSW